MDGTTLCPHCDTRFKIAVSQLEAHQGMVRCGHCLQAFNARPNFIPDQPHPQLELEMRDVVEKHPVSIEEPVVAQETDTSSSAVAEERHQDHLDFRMPVSAVNTAESPVKNTLDADEKDLTLAEQVAVADDESIVEPEKKRTWIWGVFALLLMLVVIGQVAYFFRADLAARVPGMKPVLLSYCKLLNCTVSLPQKNDLMSIESSSLEADPDNSTHITLNALLRNRASYPLAFPNLELTLNDRQDKPVARRIIRPADYLPPAETEQAGLQPNRELALKLLLDTSDLSPNGYRLAVFYPAAR
jgi:predicted Zn finger-like uncharacterized protein